MFFFIAVPVLTADSLQYYLFASQARNPLQDTFSHYQTPQKIYTGKIFFVKTGPGIWLL